MSSIRDVLLRFVINILVIDLLNRPSMCLVFAHVHNSMDGDSGGGGGVGGSDAITVAVLSPPKTAADFQFLLDQLKTELAKDSSSNNYACNGDETCTGNQYCDMVEYQCHCDKSSYVGESCPTVGNICSTCCCGRNVFCTGQICEYYQIDAISSQMILSIVMVIGVVSIVFMIYRMCYRNTLQQRILLASREDSARPSLSSLQVGVMSRMRDRPPVYDTRFNYQARNASAEGSHSHRPAGGTDNPAMDVCDGIEPRESDSSPAIYLNSPPPPYMRHHSEDPSINSTVQAPPPYSVAIKTECHGVGGGGERRGSQQQPQSQSNYKELYI